MDDATAAALATATVATAVATALATVSDASPQPAPASLPPSGPDSPGPPSSASSATVQRTLALLFSVYAAGGHAVVGIAETPPILQHLADIRHAIRLKLARCGCPYDDLARVEEEWKEGTPTSREAYDAEYGAASAGAPADHEMSRLVDEAAGSACASALLLPPLVVPNVMYEMLLSNTFAFHVDSKCSIEEHPMLHQMRAAVDTAFLMALSAELQTTPPSHDLLLVALSGVCTSMRALERSVSAAPCIGQLLVVGEVTRALSSWPATCELVTAVYDCAMTLWQGSANTRTADGERSRLKARLHHKTTLELMRAAGESSKARAHAIVHAVVFLRKTSDRVMVGAVNGVIYNGRSALQRHEGDVCKLLRNQWGWKAGAVCSTRTWQWLRGSVLDHLQRRPSKAAALPPPSPPPDRVLHDSVATAVLALVCTDVRDLQYDQCMLPETLALDVTRVREMRERFNMYTRVCCIVSIVESWMKPLVESWMDSEPVAHTFALDTGKKIVENTTKALAQCLVENKIPHGESKRLAWAAVQKVQAVTAGLMYIDAASVRTLVRVLVATLGGPAHVMLVQYGECFRESLMYAVNAPPRDTADAATRHKLDTLFEDDFMHALASTMQPLALSLVADIRDMVSNNLKVHKDLCDAICREALSRAHVSSMSCAA